MKQWLICLVSCLLWTCCASQGGCEEPPDVNFGEIVSEEKVNYQEHDRIQYRCYPGYALEGSEWISCNGQQWTPPPKCLAPCSITRQQLDAKNLLLFGGRRRSQLIRSNHTLEFMCREGYVIATPSVRKCVDGHMDLPSCISERGENCSRPPPIENGDIITLFQKEYSSGSWVEFKCQRYYALEGPNRSFCNNGTWTKVPACLEPCVLTLADSHEIVMKGSTYNNGFQMTYLPRGDSVELSCKPGYVLETNPSQAAFLIQCSEEPIVYPKCKEITCKAPQVTNGTFRPQRNMYQGGDLIQIECNPGLHLKNGQSVAECTSSGWSPSPQCGKKPCDVPTVKNGHLSRSYSDYIRRYFPRKVGETVDYLCNDGFLSLYKVYWGRSTCRDFGWDPEPKCFRQCIPPRSLPHGRLIYYYWSMFIEEDEISFACDEGYYPVSPEGKTKCTKDGWAPSPRCAGMTCRELPAVANADVLRGEEGPYLPGHQVQYQCHEGFDMSGSDTITCENERWSQPPVCNAAGGRCGHPPVIENGDVLEDVAAQFAPNSVVTYKCQRFYIMHGQPAVRCVNGHWSEAPTCLAPCTASEEDMRRNKIQLKWRSAEKLYSESGDVLEFSCTPGFMPDPSSPPFRVPCTEGRLEYPRCIGTYIAIH